MVDTMLNPLYEKERPIDKVPFGSIKTTEHSDLQGKQVRLKLWDLDHIYHCAVIGTCLTLEEVKKLLRSLQIPIKGVNSYDIHTTIVTLISYNDFGSRKVQSYLNKKFKVAIHKTKKMNATELIQEWKRVTNSGDLISTFWAVIAHPLTNDQMKRDFYGDIHMQSHMSGASNRVDLRRLNQLEKERKQVDSETLAQQNKYQKLQAENTRSQLLIQNQTEKIADLANRVTALTNANEQLTILKGVDEIDRLNIQLLKLKHKVDFQVSEIEGYKNNLIQIDQVISTLNHQISRDKKTITEYEHETEYLQYVLSQNKLADKCLFKKQGLCGQCVLYVGGKANLIPHYREMVEDKSGVFLYHDGGIEKSTQDLSQFINRADVVIFPSDCISHDAYWKIKSTCKKQQKPYEYLKSPGLYSLSNALDKVVIENRSDDGRITDYV